MGEEDAKQPESQPVSGDVTDTEGVGQEPSLLSSPVSTTNVGGVAHQAHDVVRGTTYGMVAMWLHFFELALASAAIYLVVPIGERVMGHANMLITQIPVEFAANILVAASVLVTVTLTCKEAVGGAIDKIGTNTERWRRQAILKVGHTVSSLVILLAVGQHLLDQWLSLCYVFGILIAVFALQIWIVRRAYKRQEAVG